jgi:N-acetylglucosaminyl-diphospho-decaprenol L-rhamnosyltransferase
VLDLTIIIVTYNPGIILYDCLHSLFAGVGDLSCEIIVVDNASQDGIIEQAAEQFPAVRFILNSDNRGFAGGNNQGLAEAIGQYLLLLNPDVIVEPDSLKVLVDFLKNHPEAGVAGPHTFDGEGNLSLTAFASYNTFTILWQYIGLNRLFPNHVYGHYRRRSAAASKPFAVEWIQACCLLTRREVYAQIGGLDEGLFLFAEDPDFCDRAARAGWKTYFVPDAHIMHLESAVISRYPERRIRNYHISPLHYFHKRKQESQVRLLKLGFSVELGVKCVIALVGELRGKNIATRLPIYWKVLREIWRF